MQIRPQAATCGQADRIYHYFLNRWGGRWLVIDAGPVSQRWAPPEIFLGWSWENHLLILFWILWETVSPAPWASESLPVCQAPKFPSLPRPVQKLRTAGREGTPGSEHPAFDCSEVGPPGRIVCWCALAEAGEGWILGLPFLPFHFKQL